MPNVKNVVAGTAFLALAGFAFYEHASPWLIGLLFAAAFYLYALAATGMSSDGLSDLNDAIDFVGNPTRTIADRAVDQIAPKAEAAGGRFRELWSDFVAEVRDDKPEAAPAKEFDPDAVIARYLAERPQRPEVGDAAEARAPHPTFGRKKV